MLDILLMLLVFLAGDPAIEYLLCGAPCDSESSFLFLFCVALLFILRALHVLKSSRALCPRVSSFFLAFLSPRLGKRELVCVLLVYLFVGFVRVSFCHFSLHLGM